MKPDNILVLHLLQGIRSVFEQKVVPFYSLDDVPKGLAWFDAIVAQLTRSDIGIACLTSESLHSPWLHMEIGVLYQVLSSTKPFAKKDFKILPFSFEIDEEQFNKHPLCLQHTLATKEDTQILFRTINNSLAELGDEPLSDVLLNQRFNESARGGAWNSPRRELRCAMRKPLKHYHTSAEVGFRVVCRKGY